MKKAHILLVEDEPFLAQVVADSLEQRQYQVTHAGDGQQALDLFRTQPFSLCIVDVMLPTTDGFTLVEKIRLVDQAIPILYLTARTATKDLMEGYRSGGNDYLKKPFSLEELFLRIRELLKRSAPSALRPAETVSIGRYAFLAHQQSLQLPDQGVIRLSHRETQLLQLLYDHQNQILERRHILLGLWGDDSYFHGRTLDVFITKLRKHLKADPSVEILTLRGVGYRLVC
ncbi:response regulator transcription factor [Dyadobacter aurulentus]|uniref:response regulator transcription factor n=1 Tax=Dyadobacter sp. UC 10 TaxID=2605428 RepID=UPI0011F10847|nr:response regulator transcription factor [Dyadobacter sp. UC 10]KAA0992233.1 response regulator transcription factor [Dyadobacter sp. UC 10]